MESLCAAINELCSEKHVSENVGELAAGIVRKNKELFEKKSNDVEAFLLHCSPNVGSAAMVAAIKGMFDTSAAKNNETGTDRAVELLNHYVDENNFVGGHLKLVPEIIFPLLRDVGLYCLEKKNKPEIGQRIIMKALGSMFPRNGSNAPNVLTSAHGVLFACALETKDYASVEPFIDLHVDEIANENCIQDQEKSDNRERDFGDVFLGRMKKGAAFGSQPVAHNPHLHPKYVLDYLYNGACILIELKRFEDALFLLEICVGMPAFSVQDQHLDSFKKYVLISLILKGKVDVTENGDKSAIRHFKTKSPEYKQFSEIRFSRSSNTHSAVESLVKSAKDRLRKDGNTEIAKYLVVEMKKKTIMSLTRMFTSIRISEIEELAFLKSRDQVTELIGQLVEEQRITVRIDGDMVFWTELSPVPSKNDVENKIRIVDHLNTLLHEKNTTMKAGSGRMRPSVMYNEDEGLSMPPTESKFFS